MNRARRSASPVARSTGKLIETTSCARNRKGWTNIPGSPDLTALGSAGRPEDGAVVADNAFGAERTRQTGRLVLAGQPGTVRTQLARAPVKSASVPAGLRRCAVRRAGLHGDYPRSNGVSGEAGLPGGLGQECFGAR